MKKSLLEVLELSPNGKSWLNWLDEECVKALNYIDERLDHLWTCNHCHPTRNRVMLPFLMLRREDVKLVMICKEPYDSEEMATGIPVDSGGILDTPSSNAFRQLISMYWNKVDKDKFMMLYYASGILVINASFTIQHSVDRKYSMINSHYPLWTNFMVPFLRKLGKENVQIVTLGLEGKLLVRDNVPSNLVRICSFPHNKATQRIFMDMMTEAVSDHVFDIWKPLSESTIDG